MKLVLGYFNDFNSEGYLLELYHSNDPIIKFLLTLKKDNFAIYGLYNQKVLLIPDLSELRNILCEKTRSFSKLERSGLNNLERAVNGNYKLEQIIRLVSYNELLCIFPLPGGGLINLKGIYSNPYIFNIYYLVNGLTQNQISFSKDWFPHFFKNTNVS
ncbi:MAG: hypothetical protein QXE31_02520 [Candidatus Woesearchaeota archaeon]